MTNSKTLIQQEPRYALIWLHGERAPMGGGVSRLCVSIATVDVEASEYGGGND